MTVLANFRRLDVRHWLASPIRAIMALCAVIHDVQVIEGGGQPRHRRMTFGAIVLARNMRRVFAGGRHSVMAAEAISDDIYVVEVGRSPR